MSTTGYSFSLPLRPSPTRWGETAATAIVLSSDDEAMGDAPQPTAASCMSQPHDTVAPTSQALIPSTLRRSARLMGKSAATTPAADDGTLSLSLESSTEYVVEPDQLNYQPKLRQAKGNQVLLERSQARVVDDDVQVSDAGPKLTQSDVYRCQQAFMKLGLAGHEFEQDGRQHTEIVQRTSVAEHQLPPVAESMQNDLFLKQSSYVSLASKPTLQPVQMALPTMSSDSTLSMQVTQQAKPLGLGITPIIPQETTRLEYLSYKQAARKQLKNSRRKAAKLRKAQEKANQLTKVPDQTKKMRKAQNRLKRAQEEALRAPGADVQVLISHRQLHFWKDKYYRELQIGQESQLADAAAQSFERSTITTVVPNRYTRWPSTVIEAGEKAGLSGSVEILAAVPAVEQAYKEHTIAKHDVTRLVLWTDGSTAGSDPSKGKKYRRKYNKGKNNEVIYNKGNRGFAVAWRRSTNSGWGSWEAAGYKAIGELLHSSEIEKLAIIKAFDKAIEIVRQSPDQIKAVAIYSDAICALDCAKAGGAGGNNPIGQHMTIKAQQLRRLGADVSLHWCPGHSKVPGNVLADRIAAYASIHEYDGMAEVVDLSDDE